MQQNQAISGSDISRYVQVGLLWDTDVKSMIDLDLQCVLLNEIGQVEDAVYYNQLTSKIANIHHSGDSLGEKEGFDEVMVIDLQSCQFQVKYIAMLVCSSKGQQLSNIESCMFDVYSSEVPINMQAIQNPHGKQICEIALGGLKKAGNSLVACVFEKSYEGKWRMAKTEEVGEGKNFLESENLLKRSLVIGLGFDEILFSECKNWSGGKSFTLEKNCPLLIPPVIKTIAVGLGWESTCDIDTSILLFNGSGAMVDNIYFGKKSNANGSVVHSGDNMSGVGKGDDEVIKVKLDKIPQDVGSIWAVITIYSSGKQFDDVSGAYCRMFVLPEDENKQIAGKEFCKFNLSQNKDNISNGSIMCSINKAKDGYWSVSPKGFYTRSTKTSREMIPIIQDMMKNDYSSVQTIDQIYQKFPQLQIDAIKKEQEKAQERAIYEGLMQAAQQKAEQVKQAEQAEYAQQAEQALKERLQKQPLIVEFEVVSATGLGSFDSNGLSDPYVVLFFNKKKFAKTEVMKKTLSPTWNFKTTHSVITGDTVKFELWDRDTFVDEFMGASFIHFTQPAVSVAAVLPVLDKHEQPSNKFTGFLTVNIRVIPQ